MATQAADTQIATRILSIIRSRGLSYAELARRMGVTATTIWNWAEGNHAISVTKLAELAGHLNVDPAFLAFGEGKEESVDSSLVTLPEVVFSQTGVMRIARDWSVSRRFVERALRYSPDSLVLFEVTSNWTTVLKTFDIAICNLAMTSPESDGEGLYLVFGEGRAHIFYLTLISDHGVKAISQTPVPAPPIFDQGGCKVIGKMVGAIQHHL